MLKYQLGFMWCFTIKETGFQVIQISDNDNNLNIEFFQPFMLIWYNWWVLCWLSLIKLQCLFSFCRCHFVLMKMMVKYVCWRCIIIKWVSSYLMSRLETSCNRLESWWWPWLALVHKCPCQVVLSNGWHRSLCARVDHKIFWDISQSK